MNVSPPQTYWTVWGVWYTLVCRSISLFSSLESMEYGICWNESKLLLAQYFFLRHFIFLRNVFFDSLLIELQLICILFFIYALSKVHLKLAWHLDGNRAYVWLFMLVFLLCSASLSLVSPHLNFSSTLLFFLSVLILLLYILAFGSFALCFALFCLSYSFSLSSLASPAPSFSVLSCPSLSQITVSVAQGRVRSPSPQPRYKSYAYTQAAYVKSPEQKRRRFTDQVRVLQR